jgi:hypothetical protein
LSGYFLNAIGIKEERGITVGNIGPKTGFSLQTFQQAGIQTWDLRFDTDLDLKYVLSRQMLYSKNGLFYVTAINRHGVSKILQVAVKEIAGRVEYAASRALKTQEEEAAESLAQRLMEARRDYQS